MAGYHFQASHPSETGNPNEHRFTVIEMWIQYLDREMTETKRDIERVRTTAFHILLAIAGSAILLVINVLLAKP